MADLSYYHDWSHIFAKEQGLEAIANKRRDISYVKVGFRSIQKNNHKSLKVLNTSFSGWINNNVIRDLSEYFMFYLLGVYEVCIISKHSHKELTPEDVVRGRLASQKFEKSGMKERLRILRKDFGIVITHSQQLISICDLRNIFSHYDGVVQRKFCRDQGELKVQWPVSRYKLRKTGTGKWVPFCKVKMPFSADDYDEMSVVWFKDTHVKTYVVGDKVRLSEEELNDLIGFYKYAINETHQQFVRFFKSKGFKAKNFEKYVVKPVFQGVDEDGVNVDFDYLKVS